MHNSLKFSSLISLLLSAITVAVSHAAGAEDDDLCEFETPELVTDYWPVFLEDPTLSRDGKYPIIDVVVGEDGKPIASSPVGSSSPTERVILKMVGNYLMFTPAYACGEKVEGFKRCNVSSFFYVAEEDRGKFDSLPVANFTITRKIFNDLQYVASYENKDELHLTMTLTKEGLLDDMDWEDKWGKILVKKFFKSIREDMKFIPASKNGEPVDVKLHLTLRANSWNSGNTLAGFDLSKVSKPMPRKLKERAYPSDKVHSVKLDFDRDGVLWDIQFLSVMDFGESLSALNAFRRWNLGQAPDREGGHPGSLVVRYAFTDDADEAVLIEETTEFEQTPPRPFNRPPPYYPDTARQLGMDGNVVIAFIIDREGNVRNPRVEYSTSTIFEHAALKAIEKWKYHPATMAGQPVACRARQPIPFRFHR